MKRWIVTVGLVLSACGSSGSPSDPADGGRGGSAGGSGTGGAQGGTGGPGAGGAQGGTAGAGGTGGLGTGGAQGGTGGTGGPGTGGAQGGTGGTGGPGTGGAQGGTGGTGGPGTGGTGGTGGQGQGTGGQGPGTGGASGTGGGTPLADTPVAGEVLITEVMPASTIRSSAGRYVELTNVSGKTVDLIRCRLNASPGGMLPVPTNLVVPANGIVTLAGTSPGFTPDLAYLFGFPSLQAAAGTLTLECPNSSDVQQAVDTASWSTAQGTFNSAVGASLIMDPTNLTAAANDSATSWCASSSVYDSNATTKDYGTPGRPNDACVLPAPITGCGLLAPLYRVTAFMDQQQYDAWVHVPGFTTIGQSQNDVNPLIRAQLLFAPFGTTTDPSTWEIHGNANPTATWSAPTASADSYSIGAFFVPGIVAYAFRFSSNGGVTWSYCDANGGTFNPADAGKVKLVNPFLHFTEYLHRQIPNSSSADMVLEIHNPTSSNSSMSACKVKVYSDGSSTSPLEIQLPAVTLAPGDSYVICDNNPPASVAAVCDQATSSGANLVFDGNDVITLECGTQIMDAIGQIGSTTAWGTDITLRRSCVPGGDPVATDAFDVTEEWTAFAGFNLDDFGQYSCP